MTTPRPDQYDGFADAYDAHAEAAPYNTLYDRPATIELLGDVSGHHVLDIGCGAGWYAEQLLARGATVAGCDGSTRMIELAKERLGDQLDLRVHTFDDPFSWLADESIDTVLCALAYHYANNRPALLSEMHRVLKPGGAFVLSTHHPTREWLRLGGSYFDRTAHREMWKKGFEVTAWRAPLTKLTTEFADAGFMIERLVEPMPSSEMEETAPKAYAKLTTEPGFIFFRLRKPRI